MANEESVIRGTEATVKKAKRTPKRSGRRGSLATIRELSEDGNVPYSTVRELMLEGHLPFVQLGNSKVRRAKWADWDRLIAASTETAEHR